MSFTDLDNDLKISLNTLKRKAKIEELEKIKEEIIENQYITCGLTCIPYGDCKYFDCIEVKEVIECLELIEKHISELKGENKK